MGSSPYSYLIVLIFLVPMGWLMWQQSQQQKKQKAMQSSIKVGDLIVTTGGLQGMVMGNQDDMVRLRIADKVEVNVARWAINTVQGRASKDERRKARAASEDKGGPRS